MMQLFKYGCPEKFFFNQNQVIWGSFIGLLTTNLSSHWGQFKKVFLIYKLAINLDNRFTAVSVKP